MHACNACVRACMRERARINVECRVCMWRMCVYGCSSAINIPGADANPDFLLPFLFLLLLRPRKTFLLPFTFLDLFFGASFRTILGDGSSDSLLKSSP